MLRVMVSVIVGMLLADVADAGRGYYVATSGSDAATGTYAQPWRTVGKANTTLQAGDTVYIRGGAYSDVILPKNSGTSGAPIVYTRYQSETATLLGESAAMKGVVGIGWDLASNSQDDPKSYIIVDGLVIRYQFANQYIGVANRFGYVQIGNPASQYNTIRNCVIIQNGDPLDNYVAGYKQAGILVTDAKHTLIEGNDISGTWLGVWLAGAPPRFTVIRGNNIHDIGSSTIDIADPETGQDGYQGNLIEFNLLSGSVNEDGIQFESNYQGDPALSTSNRGTIVRYNVIRGCAENALDLKGTSNILIQGNIIYGNTGDDNGPVDGHDRNGGVGGLMHGAYTTSKDIIVRNNIFYDNLSGLLLEAGYKVYNNTILANNRDWTGPNSTYSVGPGRGFTGVVAFKGSRVSIKNNIFAHHADGQIALNLEGLTSLAIDNNLYWSSDDVHLTDIAGDKYATYGLEAWRQRLASQGFPGGDGHSVQADPLFDGVVPRLSGVYPLSSFSLSSGSPAIDAGGELTHTVGGGSGTSITVADAGYFCDGYGIVSGDTIVVGMNIPVGIISIDYPNQILHVDRAIEWSSGTPVHRPYVGAAPDIGALESGIGDLPAVISAGPIAAIPANGSTGVFLSNMMKWSGISGIEGYRIQVSMNPSFTSNIIDENIDGITSYPLASLGYATKYYWRVCALDQGVSTAWSSVWQFETAGVGMLPQKGIGDVVTNGDFESGTQKWGWYTNGVGTFRTSGPAFDGSQAAQIIITGHGSNTQLYQTDIALQPNAEYRLTYSAYSTGGHGMAVKLLKQDTPWTDYSTEIWRVSLGTCWKTYSILLKTANFSETVNDALIQFWFADSAAEGEVYWIDGVSLVRTSTASSPGVNAQPATFGLEQNYPNPFNPATKIRYSLPVSSQVTLHVYTILGAEVAGIDEGVQSAGTHEVTFNGSTLASGPYFYRLRAGDRVDTKRMLLIR